MGASERRVVRFFGPRGDLLVADPAGVSVCDASGSLRFRVAIDGVLDAIAVDSELWVAARERLTRVAIASGEIVATETILGIDAPGQFIQSRMVPAMPVWHGAVPLVISVGPGKYDDNGKRMEINVRTGDTVYYGKYSGTDVEVDGEKFVILRESDILGVLE